MKAPEVLLGQIYTSAPRVRIEVSQNVHKLESGTQMDSVVSRPRVTVTEDFNRDQADSGRDAITVQGQLIESFVPRAVQIHFKTKDQILEWPPRDVETLDRLSQRSKLGPVLEFASAYVCVTLLHFPAAAGHALGPFTLWQSGVRSVIATAGKSVYRLVGPLLLPRQEDERIVEVRGGGVREMKPARKYVHVRLLSATAPFESGARPWRAFTYNWIKSNLESSGRRRKTS